MDIEQVLGFARDESIENVDIKFSNLFGGLHHITLPVERLKPELFERGIGIDGSSIPGFRSGDVNDLLLIPEPSTMKIDPYWERRTLSMMGGVYEVSDKEPFHLDSRHVARQAELFLVETGIADMSIWGPELEFYIFDSATFANEINLACYRIDSPEAGWGQCERCGSGTDYPIPRQSGYHTSPPQDRYFNLRDRISAQMHAWGIEVKYHHHEVGGPGQSEIEVEFDRLLPSGDASLITKYICKMEAKLVDCCTTFMPKPLYKEAGSGLHFHQQLFSNGKPLFYDPKGYAGLSKTALYYIGGLLEHGPALMAITNPSTNSYKRLVPGFEAPTKCIFGHGNRAAAVRIPKYADRPESKRIEFRPPDATCNAYLAMAAQLMAGIDGMKNQIDPTQRGLGPVEGNLTNLTPEQLEGIPSLPASLPEALSALENDHKFLLVGDVFTKELIDTWISWKLEKEYNEVSQRPHPYEMQLYFNV